MNEATAHLETSDRRAHPWSAVILAVLMVAGVTFLSWLVFRTPDPSPALVGQTAANTIDAAELAQRHGLQVRLIGVTGGGGMIDFRLKIVDPVKARAFLRDPANLPHLIAAESGVELMAPEELDEEIEWSEGNILFSFYPNDGGAIAAGSPVVVKFGDLYLEPMMAQ